jgi:hypothetical protein
MIVPVFRLRSAPWMLVVAFAFASGGCAALRLDAARFEAPEHCPPAGTVVPLARLYEEAARFHRCDVTTFATYAGAVAPSPRMEGMMRFLVLPAAQTAAEMSQASGGTYEVVIPQEGASSLEYLAPGSGIRLRGRMFDHATGTGDRGLHARSVALGGPPQGADRPTAVIVPTPDASSPALGPAEDRVVPGPQRTSPPAGTSPPENVTGRTRLVVAVAYHGALGPGVALRLQLPLFTRAYARWDTGIGLACEAGVMSRAPGGSTGETHDGDHHDDHDRDGRRWTSVPLATVVTWRIGFASLLEFGLRVGPAMVPTVQDTTGLLVGAQVGVEGTLRFATRPPGSRIRLYAAVDYVNLFAPIGGGLAAPGSTFQLALGLSILP